MSILVVDDAPDIRELLKSILSSAGLSDVSMADSAYDAFARLGLAKPEGRNARFDLILLNIMMPDMDGISACRRIKAVEQLRDIPIIMVTGRTELEDLQTAFAAGAMDYITKPLNTVELLARVSSALTLKHEIDARKAREQELRERQRELEQALREVKILRGIIPICTSCKKIRDDQGYWHTVEAYIKAHSEADLGHGLCPECMDKRFPA